MRVASGAGNRRAMISARDALVFVVIALVAVVLIEGIIISNVTTPAATLVRTSTFTVDPTGDPSTTTVTVVSTSTAPATASTETYTTVLNFTITNSPTTSTSTAQNSSTSTTTSTTSSTLTPTTNASGSYVVIPAGTATSGAVTNGYDPDNIVVVLGVNNSVTWVNEDSVPHTVTSRSSIQPFDSGQIQPGGSFTFVFLYPGTYTYTCDNFAWMSGVVTVESR